MLGRAWATPVTFGGQVPRLYSYTIPADDGAAPNPFNGMCSLAICKPKIRSSADVGDWVAGLGAGSLAGTLVYAMRVDEIQPMSEYDRLASYRWPDRIPDVKSPRIQRRLGDCIYDYSSGKPVQRRGVHNEGNVVKDLGGLNVLLSYHYFYFGGKPIPLPRNLHGIVHQTQGHKSKANDSLVEAFISWIEEMGLPPGQYGWPGHTLPPEFWQGEARSGCDSRCEDDDGYSVC